MSTKVVRSKSEQFRNFRFFEIVGSYGNLGISPSSPTRIPPSVRTAAEEGWFERKTGRPGLNKVFLGVLECLGCPKKWSGPNRGSLKIFDFSRFSGFSQFHVLLSPWRECAGSARKSRKSRITASWVPVCVLCVVFEVFPAGGCLGTNRSIKFEK